MLRDAGHEVELHLVDSGVINSLAGKAGALLRASHDPSRENWAADLVRTQRPDIVHVHNFFPLLTPAVHFGAARAGAAVVQTLHNFRTICAGAMLMRNEAPCEKCLAGSPLWGVVHRCYHGSLPGSLAITAMQARARRTGVWTTHTHRIIALTEFARTRFIAGGLPADRIRVKPNTIAPPTRPSSPGTRRFALFVGRLSPEKGAAYLVRAWHAFSDIPLVIVGSGPEQASLRAMAPANVEFRGQLSAAGVQDALASARILIMPSLSYEGLPMALLEAFAQGVPVAASAHGSLAELVEPGRTGALFPAGDSDGLVAVLRPLLADPARLGAMGAAARAVFAARYAPKNNLALLENIYHEAIVEADITRTRTRAAPASR